MDIIARGDEDVVDAKTDTGCSGHSFKSFMAIKSLNIGFAAGVLLHHLIGENCMKK